MDTVPDCCLLVLVHVVAKPLLHLEGRKGCYFLHLLIVDEPVDGRLHFVSLLEHHGQNRYGSIVFCYIVPGVVCEGSLESSVLDDETVLLQVDSCFVKLGQLGQVSRIVHIDGIFLLQPGG